MSSVVELLTSSFNLQKEDIEKTWKAKDDVKKRRDSLNFTCIVIGFA